MTKAMTKVMNMSISNTIRQACHKPYITHGFVPFALGCSILGGSVYNYFQVDKDIQSIYSMLGADKGFYERVRYERHAIPLVSELPSFEEFKKQHTDLIGKVVIRTGKDEYSGNLEPLAKTSFADQDEAMEKIDDIVDHLGMSWDLTFLPLLAGLPLIFLGGLVWYGERRGYPS